MARWSAKEGVQLKSRTGTGEAIGRRVALHFDVAAVARLAEIPEVRHIGPPEVHFPLVSQAAPVLQNYSAYLTTVWGRGVDLTNEQGALVGSSDLEEIFGYVCADGGRLISNSWGAPEAGQHTGSAILADPCMGEHPDAPLFFPAGNNGTEGPVEIGSPATAKCVVSVGATNNGKPGADSLGSCSSRGPAADGRTKPTITAPGTITSTSSTSDFAYAARQATSMPNAAAAGSITASPRGSPPPCSWSWDLHGTRRSGTPALADLLWHRDGLLLPAAQGGEILALRPCDLEQQPRNRGRSDIRAQDSAGNWGLVESYLFYVGFDIPELASLPSASLAGTLLFIAALCLASPSASRPSPPRPRRGAPPPSRRSPRTARA